MPQRTGWQYGSAPLAGVGFTGLVWGLVAGWVSLDLRIERMCRLEGTGFMSPNGHGDAATWVTGLIVQHCLNVPSQSHSRLDAFEAPDLLPQGTTFRLAILLFEESHLLEWGVWGFVISFVYDGTALSPLWLLTGSHWIQGCVGNI
jgi:hypothetical protein